jgi:hypothetical protein
MLCHSPVARERDPTSELNTRKSDSTVSCCSSAACQHTRKLVLTVSCRSSAVGCKIKKTVGHSPVACQRDPTSELNTRKSDSTVSCCKSMACQHTRRSVSTVSCRKSAAGCRIKQETKSSIVPMRKPTSIPTRCWHSHRSSSASSAALEASPTQRHQNQNSSFK